MDNELTRLASFFSFPYPSSVSPTALAKAGFHYEGNKDEVVCHRCHLKYSNWQSGDDPLSKHLELSPSCLFLQITGDCSEEDHNLISSLETEDRHRANEVTAGISTGIGSLSVSDNDNSRTNSASQIMHNDWMTNTKNDSSVASRSGDKEDQVLLQNVADHQANRDSTPNGTQNHNLFGLPNNNEGKSQFPRNGEDVPNTMRTGENSTIGHSDPQSRNSNEAMKLETVLPRYPEFAILSTRIRSYQNWPKYLKQRPEDLAKAGLFYEGESDYVRCFHCAGGLRQWDPEDDPFFEHARWFPFCPFMRLVKGDQFIMGVQSGTLKPTDYRTPDTGNKAAVKDLFVHPAVLSLKDIGYSTDVITKALDAFLKKKDGATLNAEHLLQIVFDMEENDEDIGCVSSEENTATNNFLKVEETPESHCEKEALGNDISSSPAGISGLAGSTTSDLEMLREQNRELREQKTCKVCLDEEASIVFLPCGHLVTCPMCASALRKCPVCRTHIRGTVKAIIS